MKESILGFLCSLGSFFFSPIDTPRTRHKPIYHIEDAAGVKFIKEFSIYDDTQKYGSH